MFKLSILLAALAAANCRVARADLVTHAIVSCGNATLNTVENFGTTHAAATNTYSSPGLFTGAAESWAGYGLVRAVASANTQNTSFNTQLVQAEAAFSDVFTVSGGSGPGFITYEYTFTGNTIGTEQEAHGHAFIRHQGEPDEELEHLTGSAVITSLPHSFTYGVPFTAGLLLSAAVHLDLGYSGVALSDFSTGAMLTGFSVYDAQMNPVSQFSLSSGSGTTYPLPSPSTLGLVTLAAVWAGFRRRA